MIFTALCTAWHFKDRGSASAMLLSHVTLQHYQEVVLPCGKTDGRTGSRLSLVPLLISIPKVCSWETQVWNSTMTRHANLSPSCAWCRKSTGMKKWGCWQSFMQQWWAVFGSLRHMGGAVGSWSLSLLQHFWAEADDMGFWAMGRGGGTCWQARTARTVGTFGAWIEQPGIQAKP